MTWRAMLPAVLVGIGLSGCGQSPTSPAETPGGLALAAGGGDSTAVAAKGKPGPTRSFNLAFFDAVHTPHPINDNPPREPLDGSDVSGGSPGLTGTVSGAVGSRVFTLTGGTFNLTIKNVRQGHGTAANCGVDIQNLLVAKGLVGAPLTGTATSLQMNETDDTVELVVDGILADGKTWHVVLFSTSGARAEITETGGVVTVIQNYGEVGFRAPAPRGNKNVEAYGCRLYFAFTLAPL